MEDEDEGVRAQWLKDPHTQKLAREAADAASATLKYLFAACGQSTDPAVRAAYTASQAAAHLAQSTFGNSNPVRKTPPRGSDEQKESPKVPKPRQPHNRRARAAAKESSRDAADAAIPGGGGGEE